MLGAGRPMPCQDQPSNFVRNNFAACFSLVLFSSLICHEAYSAAAPLMYTLAVPSCFHRPAMAVRAIEPKAWKCHVAPPRRNE